MPLYFFLPIILVFMYFLYPYYFGLSYFETDFIDYCVGIEVFDSKDRYFPSKRSKLVASLPWLFSGLGILQSLTVASMLSVLGIIYCIVAWTKQFSVPAAWIVSGLLLCCAPLIGLTRFLNFYPEISVCLCLSGFLTSKALWTPSRRHFLLAGLGIGLCFLCDVRGLIWGGFYGSVLLFFVLGQTKGLGNKVVNLISLGFPVWLSWFAGWWAFHKYSSSLIRQMDTRPLRGQMLTEYPTSFLWGYGSISSIPANIFFLLNNPSISEQSTPSSYWYFWSVTVIFSIGILLYRQRETWKLIAPLVPFLLAFWSIGSMVEPHVRFYAQALPPLLIPIAVFLSRYLQHWKTIVPFLSVSIWGALWFPHFWNIEREISNKLLRQAFPQSEYYQQQTRISGTPVHIQALPVSAVERQITQDWEQICIEALQKTEEWHWFDK